jgi:hypothetical protein
MQARSEVFRAAAAIGDPSPSASMTSRERQMSDNLTRVRLRRRPRRS